MTGPRPVGGPTPPPGPDHAKLRKAAQNLEAVFLNQLFQAMRSTVPTGGVVEASPGEAMFTAMLDERLSQVAAQRMDRGLGEALYRQLSRHLPPPASKE